MHPRRKARIGVLSALYAETLINEEPKKILSDLFEREEFGSKNREFIQALFMESLSQMEECDQLIKIPMLGKSDSLNLAVSTGIILYESIRKFPN